MLGITFILLVTSPMGPLRVLIIVFFLLTLKGPQQAISNPFSDSTRLDSYEHVHCIVRQQWQHPVHGLPMFRITQQLKCIKNKLKSWKVTSSANCRKQIEKNTEKLHYMENRLIDNADNPRLNHWHTTLIKQRGKLMLFHQRFWGRLTRKFNG